MNELRHTRVIHDPVHGGIKFTEEEIGIIDHVLFQRLQESKQTDLLVRVFPGMTHARFAHSLGTVYMAQRMLSELCSQSVASSNKLYPLEDAQVGQAVRFHELDKHLLRDIQRLTRIAALVHDLGHGPLSHAFEKFAPTVMQIQHVLKDPRLSALDRPELHTALLKPEHGDRVRHEAISCILFACIWNEQKGDPQVTRAIAMILLGVNLCTAEAKEILPWIPLIRDLISSAPIDADRMDYLERDSLAAGVPYGRYHKGRILKSLLCVCKESGQGKAFGVGWKESGLSAIESFVYGRFKMYAEVYWHKTHVGTRIMLEEIAKEMNRCGISLMEGNTLDDLIDCYCLYGDETLLKMLAGTWKGRLEIPPQVQEIAQAVYERRLWKRVYKFRPYEENLRMSLYEDLQKAYPDTQFLIDKRPLRATKGLDQGANLITTDRNRKYSRMHRQLSWTKASPLIEVYTRSEQNLLAIYVKGWPTKEGLCALKEHAQQFVVCFEEAQTGPV